MVIEKSSSSSALPNVANPFSGEYRCCNPLFVAWSLTGSVDITYLSEFISNAEHLLGNFIVTRYIMFPEELVNIYCHPTFLLCKNTKGGENSNKYFQYTPGKTTQSHQLCKCLYNYLLIWLSCALSYWISLNLANWHLGSAPLFTMSLFSQIERTEILKSDANAKVRENPDF